ncbi:MAG: glycosyltransferase [Stagnimonas sp.]|nr:glycosyltransferase [Stagnimonas sp.]
MKLLLGVPDLDLASGGLAAVAQRLTAELAAQSQQVTLAYSVDPARPRLSLPPGVQALEYPRQGPPWQYWRQSRARLRAWLAAERPDLVHDHGLWRPENAAFQSAAGAGGPPLLVQPCGMLQDWPLRQSRLKKQLAWRLYQRRLIAGAAAVIATSEDERRETAPRLPPGPELVCIPHGVELPAAAPVLARERRAVYLGRLHPKKQVDVLLRAWARLRPPGWQLHIAGGGEPAHERELRQLAEQSGLGDSVRFLGVVQGEAKSALLAGSQLFLQPSLQENFGLAVAEALAHGLPALTTRGTPWSEVEAQGCGWWVAPDAASVQGALAQALALTPEQLAAMGERARQLAARYSWAEAARQTLALYQRVLERGR